MMCENQTTVQGLLRHIIYCLGWDVKLGCKILHPKSCDVFPQELDLMLPSCWNMRLIELHPPNLVVLVVVTCRLRQNSMNDITILLKYCSKNKMCLISPGKDV